MSKIPCGGFEFDDSLEIRDGKLSAKSALDKFRPVIIEMSYVDESEKNRNTTRCTYFCSKTQDEIIQGILIDGTPVYVGAPFPVDTGSGILNDEYNVFCFSGVENGVPSFRCDSNSRTLLMTVLQGIAFCTAEYSTQEQPK